VNGLPAHITRLDLHQRIQRSSVSAVARELCLARNTLIRTCWRYEIPTRPRSELPTSSDARLDVIRLTANLRFRQPWTVNPMVFLSVREQRRRRPPTAGRHHHGILRVKPGPDEYNVRVTAEQRPRALALMNAIADVCRRRAWKLRAGPQTVISVRNVEFGFEIREKRAGQLVLILRVDGCVQTWWKNPESELVDLIRFIEYRVGRNYSKDCQELVEASLTPCGPLPRVEAWGQRLRLLREARNDVGWRIAVLAETPEERAVFEATAIGKSWTVVRERYRDFDHLIADAQQAKFDCVIASMKGIRWIGLIDQSLKLQRFLPYRRTSHAAGHKGSIESAEAVWRTVDRLKEQGIDASYRQIIERMIADELAEGSFFSVLFYVIQALKEHRAGHRCPP
jgi:hypothetical protein